jgi:hypothetical protein
MASNILKDVASLMVAQVEAESKALRKEIHKHEMLRHCGHEAGSRTYSEAKELSSLRSRLRSLDAKQQKGFNADSPQQRMTLLYEVLKFPEVLKRKSKTRTSDEKAVESLVSRMERGMVKPKGVSKEQGMRVLKALVAVKKWAHWRRAYLQKELR